MKLKLYTTCFLFLVLLQVSSEGWAQRDTSGKQTIDITSSFKPVLRNAAKINFNAAAPAPDTSKPRLNYGIPINNLYLSYQPVALKPLALEIDSSAAWDNSNYIKAGFGNLRTPFLQAGFSFGTEKAKLNILANHISSHGKIENQDYGRTNFNLYGFAPIARNVELHGKFGVFQDKYYLYGYDHNLYSYSKSQVMQRYQTFTAEAGIRNLAPTEFGLQYHPRLIISMFNDNWQNNESNATLDLPLEKSIGDIYGIRLGVKADLTRYSPDKSPAISNTIFTVPFTLLFKTPNFIVNGGITPSWDNSTFHLLPNFMADINLSEDRWVFQVGWISYFEKGSYQRLASINPFLAKPNQLLNTRIVERYAGFKGTILDHFTYNAKIGSIEYNNMPLYVNDSADGKTFKIIFEQQLKAFQLAGQFGIVEAESFSLHTGLNFLNYGAQKTESNAWGLIPIELNASMRWQIMKDLWLKGDFFVWSGPKYRTKSGASERQAGATDLSAGLEFRITRQLRLWAQFNNIFNSHYQRWNQYDSYGFNLLGGIVFSFKQ